LQEYRGNNLVMWEAIKHLCHTGAKTLHFGRTSPFNSGLKQFKRWWGAEEEPLQYWRLEAEGDWTSVASGAPSLSRHIFRRLPSRANRLAGTLLYPHMD
jgi:hypothetical protein